MSNRTVVLQPWGWQYPALDMVENSRIAVVAGGRGCLRGDMMVKTPPSGNRSIRDIWHDPGCEVVTPFGIGQAWPGRTGRESLVALRHEAGELIGTKDHLVLTSSGWTCLSELSLGALLPIACHQPSFGSQSPARENRSELLRQYYSLTASCALSCCPPNEHYRIAGVREEGVHEFFDITVPGHDCYVLADGTIHHNCGKTNLAQMVIVREAFREPRRKLIYGAQSHKLVREVYQQMLDAPGFRSLLRTVRPYQEQPAYTIHFCNGSRLTMLTLGAGQEAGKSLGLEGNLLILDEAREIAEQVYNDMSPCVSRLRGRTLLLSTFKHKSHWFSKMFYLGQAPNNLGIASMKVPSYLGISYQGEEGKRELEKERATRTERIFARDFLCDFVDSDKCVFRKDLLERAKVPGLKPSTCSKEPTILAWDLGRRADPSGLTIGNLRGELLHAETLKLGVDWDLQVTRVKQLADLYNSVILVETNGTPGDSVVGLMRPRFLPHSLRAVPVRGSVKENLINRVVFRFEKGPVAEGLRIPDDPMFNEVIRQLECLEYKETSNYVGYTSEIHDEFVSCLALYCEGLYCGYGGQAMGSWSDNQRPTRYL